MTKTLDKLVQDSCAGCISDLKDIEEIFARMGKMTWGDLVDLVDAKTGEHGMILLAGALKAGYDIHDTAAERLKQFGHNISGSMRGASGACGRGGRRNFHNISGSTRGASPACPCSAGTTAFGNRTRSQPRLRGCSRGLGCYPNKQKLRFPATPGTAVSSLCIYKDIACQVAQLLILKRYC